MKIKSVLAHIVRSPVELTFTFVQCLVLTILLSFLTGTVLHFSWTICLPLLTVILAASGLGYILGSLIMVFRKLVVMRSFLVFALLFFVVAPIEEWGMSGLLASSFFPVAPSAAALRAIMVRQHFDWLLVALGIANGVFYLSVGMIAFKASLSNAKKRGAVSTF